MKSNEMHNKVKSPLVFMVTILSLNLWLLPAARAEWSIDLSRRSQHMRKEEMVRGPASVRAYDDAGAAARTQDSAASNSKSEEPSFVDRIFDPGEPTQDIVILNTERGFVPNTIRVRRDGRYMIHVVNVNEKEKNVSFILDGFSEHHATYFGKTKSFKLEPKKEGVFSFLSPETAVEGRLVVFSQQTATEMLRQPAQAPKDHRPEAVGGQR